MFDLRERAKKHIALESSIKVAIRYKTLHAGLKLNHARNVAIVHPLAYFLRRALLAVIVVYMD